MFYDLLHGKKIKARLRLIQVYFDIKILGWLAMQRHFFAILKQIVSLNGFLQSSVVTNEWLHLYKEKQLWLFFCFNNSYGLFNARSLP